MTTFLGRILDLPFCQCNLMIGAKGQGDPPKDPVPRSMIAECHSADFDMENLELCILTLVDTAAIAVVFSYRCGEMP
jgi:hypothetical protein